jgi:signal transduction histidine kinase/AmiR/NasT family two-component response regulator
MDDLRPLVVDAIAEGRRIGGFELGRIYSGLRGIVPIFEQPGVDRGDAIGAVEVGTSFDPVLERISGAAGGDYAVILSEERVDRAVFDELRADAVMDLAGCDCVLEATTSQQIRALVAALTPGFFKDPIIGERRLGRIESIGETGQSRTYEIAAWPLMDHVGATRGGVAPGWVVTWIDATPIMADHRLGLLTAAGFALAAFLALEVVIFFAVRSGMRALERRVDAATAELSATNEALVEASAAKSRFLATMSHEIRTPMNGVLGMADLLAHEPMSDKQARMLATIRSSGELLMNTISDILDVSKLEAGKVVIERIPFDVTTVAQEVVDVQEGAATKKGVRLDLSVRGGQTRREGDPHRVAQILHNLVSNAIKFSNTGAVAIGVDVRDPEGVTLSVADTGIGMTKEQARRIFDPFEQADASTTRRSGGTGLGLSIVKGLVERMGGRVDLDTAPGRGATFAVHLPLRHTKAQTTAAAPVSDGAALRGLRALAADDNEVNRLVLAAMLDRLGVKPTMVESGAEALACFERNGPFDVIFMDVVMPDMDGPETRRRIVEAGARLDRPVPPVIACTARTMPDEITALIDEGFSDHLAKPIDGGVLKTTLLRATSRTSPTVSVELGARASAV